MALNLGPSSASKSGAISVSAKGITLGVLSLMRYLVSNCPQWGSLVDYSGMRNRRQQSVGQSPPRRIRGGSTVAQWARHIRNSQQQRQSTTLPRRQLDGYTLTPAQIITSVAFMMASRVRITAVGAGC